MESQYRDNSFTLAAHIHKWATDPQPQPPAPRSTWRWEACQSMETDHVFLSQHPDFATWPKDKLICERGRYWLESWVPNRHNFFLPSGYRSLASWVDVSWRCGGFHPIHLTERDDVLTPVVPAEPGQKLLIGLHAARARRFVRHLYRNPATEHDWMRTVAVLWDFHQGLSPPTTRTHNHSPTEIGMMILATRLLVIEANYILRSTAGAEQSFWNSIDLPHEYAILRLINRPDDNPDAYAGLITKFRPTHVRERGYPLLVQLLASFFCKFRVVPRYSKDVASSIPKDKRLSGTHELNIMSYNCDTMSSDKMPPRSLFSLLALQETKSKRPEGVGVPHGYKCLHVCHPDFPAGKSQHSSGGVMWIYDPTMYNPTIEAKIELRVGQALTIRIQSGHTFVLLVNLYILPSGHEKAPKEDVEFFFAKLSDAMALAHIRGDHIVVCGDFNAPLNHVRGLSNLPKKEARYKHRLEQLRDLCLAFKLKVLHSKPTHRKSKATSRQLDGFLVSHKIQERHPVHVKFPVRTSIDSKAEPSDEIIRTMLRPNGHAQIRAFLAVPTPNRHRAGRLLKNSPAWSRAGLTSNVFNMTKPGSARADKNQLASEWAKNLWDRLRDAEDTLTVREVDTHLVETAVDTLGRRRNPTAQTVRTPWWSRELSVATKKRRVTLNRLKRCARYGEISPSVRQDFLTANLEARQKMRAALKEYRERVADRMSGTYYADPTSPEFSSDFGPSPNPLVWHISRVFLGRRPTHLNRNMMSFSSESAISTWKEIAQAGEYNDQEALQHKAAIIITFLRNKMKNEKVFNATMVMNAAHRMAVNKACGPNTMPREALVFLLTERMSGRRVSYDDDDPSTHRLPYKESWAHLQLKIAQLYANAFNALLHEDADPAWALQMVVLIPKKTTAETAADMRPISLTNASLTLFELCWGPMLKQALHGQFHPTMYGFRTGRGCLNELLYVYAQQAYHKKLGKPLVAVLFDLKKAFNSMPHEVIICGLAKIHTGVDPLHLSDDELRAELENMPKELATSICAESQLMFGKSKQYLLMPTTRYSKVVDPLGSIDGYTGAFPQERGIGQGMPNSPLMFNVGMISLTSYCNDELRMNGDRIPRNPLLPLPSVHDNVFTPSDSECMSLPSYVDDTLTVTDRVRRLGGLLTYLGKWADWSGMEWNPAATVGVKLNHGEGIPAKFNFGRAEFSWQKEATLLGCQLTTRMEGGVRKVKADRASGALNGWRKRFPLVPAVTAFMVANAVVSSTLLYGCELLQVPKNQLKLAEPTYNDIARIALGLHWRGGYTMTVARADFGMLRLQLAICERQLRFYMRMATSRCRTTAEIYEILQVPAHANNMPQLQHFAKSVIKYKLGEALWKHRAMILVSRYAEGVARARKGTVVDPDKYTIPCSMVEKVKRIYDHLVKEKVHIVKEDTATKSWFRAVRAKLCEADMERNRSYDRVRKSGAIKLITAIKRQPYIQYGGTLARYGYLFRSMHFQHPAADSVEKCWFCGEPGKDTATHVLCCHWLPQDLMTRLRKLGHRDQRSEASALNFLKLAAPQSVRDNKIPGHERHKLAAPIRMMLRVLRDIWRTRVMCRIRDTPYCDGVDNIDIAHHHDAPEDERAMPEENDELAMSDAEETQVNEFLAAIESMRDPSAGIPAGEFIPL